MGGLRDRLHIFPYTYYLVGRPGPIVRRLLAIMVGTTLLVLPLATLLLLQLRFLAYQDQAVTWAQRIAVWFNVALVIALWPVIMDRGDIWRDYLRNVGSCLGGRWRMGLAYAAVWVGVVAPGFATTMEGYFAALAAIPGLVLFLGMAGALGRLKRWWRGQRREPASAVLEAVPLVRGMPGLLLVVALGVPLPLGLLADGEWWEEKLLAGHALASEVVYDRFRHLDLREQVLLAKPAKPELLAHFREGDPKKVKKALQQIERVNLRWRSLRGASFNQALLPGADLRDAQLQGAWLVDAELQDANLERAELQDATLSGAELQGAWLVDAELQDANLERAELRGAMLSGAKLQGATLSGAQLQGANLGGSELQGANLYGAQLEGANLGEAELQGAVLRIAQLQGANLYGARLQGANLWMAGLKGANLYGAQLQGANLQSVELYGALSIEQIGTALVDLRGASWTPLEQERLAQIREMLGETIADSPRKQEALERIARAAGPGLAPPLFKSCLIDRDATPALGYCEKTWMPGQIDAFRSELFPALEELACQSSWTARGLIRQIVSSEITSGRFGLAGRFAAVLDKQECKGLSSLPEVDKNQIRDWAKIEEERRGQSEAGKPAEEVPASPTPPPAIAPETP